MTRIKNTLLSGTESTNHIIQQYNSNVCGICGKEFFKSSGLKRHMRVHLNENPSENHHGQLAYTCQVCKMSFACPDSYSEHVKMEHSQPQALKCSICACFRPITTNSKTKPFQCESCTILNNFQPTTLELLQPASSFQAYQTTVDTSVYRNLSGYAAVQLQPYNPNGDVYTTNTPSQVTGPIKVNTIVQPVPQLPKSVKKRKSSENRLMSSLPISLKPKKPFNCAQCDKSFSHSSTLAMHRKVHTGDFKYMCEYCDKTFFLNEYYTRHMRVHTKEKPYKCDVCEKAFSQSNTLTQHKRTHTGEKPYTCPHCGKTFSVKDYLNKHYRTHTGEKPYTCKICDKKYSQASGLKMHQRSHLNSTQPNNL